MGLTIHQLSQRTDLQAKARARASGTCSKGCCGLRPRDCHAEALIQSGKLNPRYVNETVMHFNSTSPSGVGLPSGSYSASAVAARQSKEALNVARAIECKGPRCCETYNFGKLVREFGQGKHKQCSKRCACDPCTCNPCHC